MPDKKKSIVKPARSSAPPSPARTESSFLKSMEKKTTSPPAVSKFKITGPEAAKLAVNYISALVQPISFIRLEEVEKVTESNKQYWLITLSFASDLPEANVGLATIIGGSNRRSMKVFKIDAETGEVLSMRMKGA